MKYISMTALRLSEPLTVDGQLADAIYPRAAWSEAFAPIDRESETVNGLYEKVEEKFRALETRVAAFVHGDDLYLAVEAPFPADVKPVAKSKSRFGGDRLDFYAVQVNGFIRLSLGADGKVSATVPAGATYFYLAVDTASGGRVSGQVIGRTKGLR